MKRLSILAAYVGLATTVCTAQAGLGWTVDESIAHYDGGKNAFTFLRTDEIGRDVYAFLGAGDYKFQITAWYTDGKMSKIRYEDGTEKGWNGAMVKALLDVNAPNAHWAGLETTKINSKETGPDSSMFFGWEDGDLTYTASLSSNFRMLAIETEVDLKAEDAYKNSP